MAWLVLDGHVLASLEIADTHRTRARGFLGRECAEGALLLRPARSVHTFGMRFPIDVAFCDGDLVVRRIVRLKPRRFTRIHWRAPCTIEAEAGSFARWNVSVGDQLEVRR